MAAALYHSYTLPWTQITNELERLKKYLIVVVATAVVLSLIIPFLPVPKVNKIHDGKLPPRLAQLVMEAQKPKPKPKPPKKKVVKKKEKEKVKKKPKKKKKPKLKKPKPKKKVKPKKTRAQKTAEARKKAQSVGLLAFVDDLADLRDTKVATLNKRTTLSKGGVQASKFKRSILTSGAVVAGSGGINTDSLSSGVGRSNLAGRETTKVDSDIDKIAKAGRTKKRKGGRPARSYEDVSLVMDRNKGAIYSIYNRYLRKDPTLEGKIVFELTIDPDGTVVAIKMISSELNSPALERKLLIRIKSFNFGARDVGQVVVTFPIDFLPS